MTGWLVRLSTTTGPVRVMGAAAAGLAAGLAACPLQGMARGLVGWCVGAVVFLALSWWLAATLDAKRCRARAQSMDDPNVLILVIMLTIAAVSVSVIVMMLQEVKKLEDVERAAHIALSVASLSSAWLLIHTVYAFHYAHRYYQGEKNNKTSGAGLDFPGKRDPDYLDFLYFSFVVGMTCQVSDIQVTSREMRRLTLVHSILSFGFNMLVLALSINVVASTI